MKILFMADLHLSFLSNPFVTYKYACRMKSIMDAESPDCVAVAGDIWEYNMDKEDNPYCVLRDMLGADVDVPVVCVFGNHEFAHSSVQDVKKHFRSFRKRYGVHILDLENSFMIDGVNFVGNAFWYDSSLGDSPECVKDFIVPGWLDSSIKDFKASEENRKCREQILKHLVHDGETVNILLTHTCPHISLNWFSSAEPASLYNQYSGCRDFLSEVSDVKYAVCGHTHKKAESEVNGIACMNIGNDYYLRSGEIAYRSVIV